VLTKRKIALQLGALVAALALVAAACGGDDDDSGGAANNSSSTTAAANVPSGGTLVVGAEQEPDCLAWIRTCAASSWGYWIAGATTMPRVYDTVKNGDVWEPKISSLVTEEPTLDDSDATKPVITYKLNPKAVWSDGQQITCDDFKYTWDQIAHGDDIYDSTGYVDIAKVDCPDPQTVVTTYSKVYSGWKQLFGGGFGVLPSHLLQGKDTLKEMGNGYTWSGGPWMMPQGSWKKGVELTLVPNPKYWGDQPKLDKIIFKFQPETATEFQAFKNGETDMIYPQPQPDVVDQIKQGLPNAKNVYSADTGNLEALWMNDQKAPLDDVNVRKAVAYALDRDALVNRLFGALGVDKAMQTLQAPILADFADTSAFSEYTLDKDKVDQLLGDAGYTKNGTYYEKNGQPLTLELKSTAGNARRELTGQLLQEQLKNVGIKLDLNYQEAGDFFGSQLPKGDFQIGLYAQVNTFIVPGQCNLFCSQNIPTAANGNSGNNWTRTDIPELDTALKGSDNTLDESKQQDLGKQADKIMADNLVSLPLDPLPNILIWADKVVGPVGDNPVLGPWWNAQEWGVQG
jgi:peptide/nickel transport system substrate-binding protein